MKTCPRGRAAAYDRTGTTPLATVTLKWRRLTKSRSLKTSLSYRCLHHHRSIPSQRRQTPGKYGLFLNEQTTRSRTRHTSFKGAIKSTTSAPLGYGRPHCLWTDSARRCYASTSGKTSTATLHTLNSTRGPRQRTRHRRMVNASSRLFEMPVTSLEILALFPYH
ncbi:hypothetical protein JG688_00010298 [Phytophthora aleatoria]|uniref:Uncharacterized protein n=1 Tax=Phytophthora aleatoria TaxID=2496075 RepID=A0A8J5IWA3_9STRA|nr:hypothetical protein JG688_00010298 [Phytophthora aleatoria]